MWNVLTCCLKVETFYKPCCHVDSQYYKEIDKSKLSHIHTYIHTISKEKVRTVHTYILTYI